MAMLTYARYKELSAIQLEETDFDRYIKPAKRIISVDTRRFYEYNEFETDPE